MDTIPLTGAQKIRLRGQGQLLEPALKIGRAGFGPDQSKELGRLLSANQLVKIRVEIGDRHERASLLAKIAESTGAICVGSVGRTALFYRLSAQTTLEPDAR